MSDENHEPDEQWEPRSCEHQWEWVQPVIRTIAAWPKCCDYWPECSHVLDADSDESYNVRCSKCGETTWAHGWNVPMRRPDPVLEQEC